MYLSCRPFHPGPSARGASVLGRASTCRGRSSPGAVSSWSWVMGKLEGKVAIVTGSGRNIGRATVLKLAAEGAHVVVNARSNQAEADAVVREAQALGVKAFAVVADIASKDQVEAMAARALSQVR